MRYSKFITILFVGSLLSSCSGFLDPDPVAAIKKDDFYSTAAELELGIGAIYDAIQGANGNQLDENRGIQIEFYVTEMLSDNSSTRAPNAEDTSDAGQFENFNVQENNGISANYYASMFRVVYLANVVLGSLDVVQNVGEATRIEAEAKFLRAYAYYNLIRLYGEDIENLGLPLVDHVLSPEELATQYIRVSEDRIYDLITSDLETATAGLDDSYTTRASKSAAHTLLAKVYMSLDNPDYEAALDNLDEVYGKYSLLDEYADVFDADNELNDEIIFAIGFVENTINDSQNYTAEFAADGNSSGVNYLTADLHANLVVNGGSNRQLYDVDNGDSEPRYQTAKHKYDRSSQTELSGVDFIVLRYADVIMLYAEANMGASDQVSISGSWAADYDKIRTRAGLTPVTSVTKEELLAERRYEFFSENKRLFDLKRFGLASVVLGSFAAVNGYNFNSTESILPIPLREINLSPKNTNGDPALVQNINWR